MIHNTIIKIYLVTRTEYHTYIKKMITLQLGRDYVLIIGLILRFLNKINSFVPNKYMFTFSKCSIGTIYSNKYLLRFSIFLLMW